MALERQSIEKKDFPVGRRGYDPDAVDAHLRAIADEVEELKHATRRRTETLASAASDQVRAIVEAAESSAAEILRQAEDEAREIRADANREARATREDSNTQAREYVSKVSEETAAMRERLEAMGTELTALLESLSTGSNRLEADLQLLARSLAEVRETAAPRGDVPAGVAGEPERPAAIEPELAPADVQPPADPEAADAEVAEAEAEVVEMPQPTPEPRAAAAGSPSEPSGGADETEGARLIALNMALSGTPREETDRYLAENFELLDRARLLDEVYESVGG